MSLHPISDKAEVSVDFPDKPYIGSFSRHSQFDAYADDDSVAIRLVRPGEDRREVVMHVHYGLLADILVELAKSLASRPELDDQHRTELNEAAKQLWKSFGVALRELTPAPVLDKRPTAKGRRPCNTDFPPSCCYPWCLELRPRSLCWRMP